MIFLLLAAFFINGICVDVDEDINITLTDLSLNAVKGLTRLIDLNFFDNK